MVQIIRAEHMGFCFGVRDALRAAESVPRPDQTAIYGQLVHNQDVTDSLRQRQFEICDETERDAVPERDSVPGRPVVMVTAHGISDRRLAVLTAAGKQIVDTTCPLVRRVHQAARGLADRGNLIVVLGAANHVEVRGIIEDLPAGRWVVVNDPDQLKCYQESRIGIVSQTTFPNDLADQIRAALSRLNPESSIRWINTICRPTRQRQTAVDALCDQTEMVIVVGGANSNNTMRLAQRCRQRGIPAHHIQSRNELLPQWFDGLASIGLTAGTSTPDAVIDSVEQQIRLLTRQCPTVARTNFDWIEYFRGNRDDRPLIPWSDQPTLSDLQLQRYDGIIASIQTFQLGESGEGRHILKVAANWIDCGGDPDYLTALRLFLAEENQHADWLGEFLRREHHPTLANHWSDNCFRWIRHLAGLRTSIMVLLTAEILAQVYYLALLRATDSPALIAICKRILRDERSHVMFQQNQSRVLSSAWGRMRRGLIAGLETLGFAIARRIVWHDHRSVFLAAGMDRRTFHRRAIRRWRAARR